jgi:lipopolysaccharide transport system ATP-binding protein
MSGDVVIRAEGLGKKYIVGHEAERESYVALRDVLTRGAKNFLRRASGILRGVTSAPRRTREEFWALQDVNFEIARGDVVGVIGRNGAGKSTLLKVLSRITEPSTGRVTINGRVASLLEVGTGFHPELTGRENIYLNGAILGMSRAEIRRKFDEIVEFAEVEKFLDTPVKRYSSGMYVRLAFSVAAHLEPEILVVDEVLAVGDGAFQKKCLGKIQQVSTGGRTVLFVSHNMASITRLCSKAILLDFGRVAATGTTQAVVQQYLSSGEHGSSSRRWDDPKRAPGNAIAKLRSVAVVDEAGNISTVCDIRRKVGIKMKFDVYNPGNSLTPNCHVYYEDGTCAFISGDSGYHEAGRRWDVGTYESTMWIPGNFLSEGVYSVGAALSTIEPLAVHFFEPDAVSFQVADSMEGDSVRGRSAGPYPGVVRPRLDWTLQTHSSGIQTKTA